MTCLETYQNIVKSKEYVDWRKKNPQAYLTHFYCQLNNSFKQITPWEIGFYNRKNDKITVFVVDKNIKIKPEDTPFKKHGAIEELDLEKVKINFQQVLEIVKKTHREHYAQEVMLNGFIILQQLQKQTIWNISFATKSFNIINTKIDAADKKVISHQSINFIERKAS